MATKRQCPACGRLQRVPDAAEDFICDGCGGQGIPDSVRRVPPRLGRRLLAAAMMLLGAYVGFSFVNDIVRRPPDENWVVTRDRFVSLVIPALLIIGGVTLARGQRELVSPELSPDQGPPDRFWEEEE
jgi:hypothetical protein